MTFKQEEQLLESLHELRLLPEERTRARDLLRANCTVSTPRPTVLAFLFRHGMASVLAVILLLAGGTTVLAHRSSPGGLFYPVKLGINDRVALAVAGDDDAKLGAELAQIGRILQEEEEAAEELFDEEESDEEEFDEEISEAEEEREAEEHERDDDEDDEERRNASANISADDQDFFDEINTELRAIEKNLKDSEQDELPEN